MEMAERMPWIWVSKPPMLNILESVVAGAAVLMKKPLSSMISIIEGEGDVLVADDGSLMSVIQLHGSRLMKSNAEFQEAVETLETQIRSYFSEPGHAIQFFWSVDPSESEHIAKANKELWLTGAAKSGLNFEDIINAKERLQKRVLTEESCYLALWTRTTILNPSSRKQFDKKREAHTSKVRRGQNATNPSKPSGSLGSTHTSFVSQMEAAFSNAGFLVDKLDAKQALNAARASIYPYLKGNEWTPKFPTDKRWIRGDQKLDKRDVSAILPPPLSEQLLVDDGYRISSNIAQIGKFYWASVDMSIGPSDPRTFDKLIARMNQTEAETPFRASFLIEGGGGISGLNGAMASILVATNKTINRRILNAVEELQKHREKGGSAVFCRISFATWSEGPLSKVEEQVQGLIKTIEGWGDCNVTRGMGDPIETVFSSAFGVHCASSARRAIAPLKEILSICPLVRPASPWSQGTIIFRTADGKAWPFEPGSSEQTSWFELMMGPPGTGKSALVNALNLAQAVNGSRSVDHVALPYIAHIDIGWSSKSLIESIQDALPSAMKHQAVYLKLQMDSKYAINPFDTPVGIIKPLPAHKQFLVRLVLALVTPVGMDAPYEGTDHLVSDAIDEAYRKLSPGVAPREYTRHTDLELDGILESLNFDFSIEKSWWDIVDLLFDNGFIKEASRAQRHAVPVLSDLNAAISEERVVALVKDAKVSGHENLTSNLNRLLVSAANSYPNLADITRFDIGDARIMSIDLSEVAPTGDAKAAQQTEVMYLLARYISANEFFMVADDFEHTDVRYKTFHLNRINEMKRVRKRITYDEFHRTGGRQGVRSQVVRDGREGRKYGVEVCLASQFINDFDDEMIELATTIFVLGKGSAAGVDRLEERFKLSKSALEIVRHNLSGPSAKGAPFLIVARTKKGDFEQYLFNTLSPEELWLLTTSQKDVQLRAEVQKLVSRPQARKLLAKAFPSGSAMSTIETREREFNESEAQGSKNVFELLAKEVVAGA